MTLSVVIPVYNEQGILAETVTAIVAAFRRDASLASFELIVSENGSTDGTRAVARELAARYEEVAVLESNSADYGAAMREGFRAASGAFIVNFDADYYDIQFVRHALAADADVVIAAKGIAGSRDTRAVLRRIGSRVFGLLVRGVLGLRARETHGMKLFRRAAIQPLLLHVQATKDLFDTELVARAEKSGLSIVELPITTAEMRHSRSAILPRVPRTVWGLVRMRQRLRQEPGQKPPVVEDPGEPPCAVPALHSSDVITGRRLFVLRHGAAAVSGAEETLIALDEAGVAVVVAVVGSARAGTGSELADELDRIAQLSAAQCRGSTTEGSAAEEAALADAHAAFFAIDDTARPTLNRAQQAVLLVREPPDAKVWQELLVELGGQLAGVYRIDGDQVVPLEVPESLRRSESPRWLPRAAFLAGAVIVLGTAVLVGIAARDSQPDGSVSRSVVRDVATGVPGAATHNQWIGQDHVVRTSAGQLVTVYGTEQGLTLVSDHADHGRVWHPPAVPAKIPATSSSLAIDDADRLHIAFGDGSRVAYAVVQQRGGRWTSSAILEVDGDAQTPYLDIAYDSAADVAHLVWVEESPAGQAPRWAAISTDDGDPRVVDTDRLATPGTDIPVLVNVSAGPGSQTVATYRAGDAPFGWTARALSREPDGDFTWGGQESVPTEAGVGAAALALDAAGVAHLVLRDSTSYALTYFTRTPHGQWSQGETAVDAESIEEIDYPSLTVDRTSRLVYLFFQTDRAGPHPAVQVVARDPVRGWETPLPVVPSEDIPDGARLPTSISETAGAPIVLWTTAGPTPVLQAAAVVP